MAKIISCPSCARKLSVSHELPAGQLLKCRACQAVFAQPADESVAQPAESDNRPRGAAIVGQFSASPFKPVRPRDHAADDYDDGQQRNSNPDDADDDWPDFRRPIKKEGKRSRVLAVGGSIALLVLVICAILFFVRSRGDSALVGSWKGTFRFNVVQIDCVYHFRPDGTMVDEHIDPNTGVPTKAKGRYTVANGVVNIQWPRQGFERDTVERATFRHTGPNSIEYVVVAHTDPQQVGAKVIFTRVAR
jgi:hypothetical protein